jgi:hypothetical protein
LDQVDVYRLKAIRRSWGDCPPLPDMVLVVARILGFEFKPGANEPSRDYSALLAMFPAGKIQ